MYYTYRELQRRRRKKVCITIAILLLLAATGYGIYLYLHQEAPVAVVLKKDTVKVAKKVYKYNLPDEKFDITYHKVRYGENLSTILSQYGLDTQQIHDLNEEALKIYDTRMIKSGQPYAIYTTRDTLATPYYMVYEIDPIRYLTFYLKDELKVTEGKKPVVWKKRKTKGLVETSLWVSMVKNNTSPQLALALSHIYGWTIDFFDLKKNDEYKVVYEQQYVDNVPMDEFHILAASFRSEDCTYYAIPYRQNGELMYFNENGKSLEGTFLKAPLDFYRITSKFSNSRFHPVLKRYRAHHGVDYAAPVGTPVYAIGSGKVIYKGYTGGGGHTVKIKHNGNYVTSYMHLSRYARGLKVGQSVKQKEVIGYVGSTGLSTGPHLDFRIYENGKAINPLLIKSTPKHPIGEADMPAFKAVSDSLMKILQKM